jgi:hypothetical protein
MRLVASWICWLLAELMSKLVVWVGSNWFGLKCAEMYMRAARLNGGSRWGPFGPLSPEDYA